MEEKSEILNLVFSTLLFIYYLYLIKGSELNISKLWVYAIFCIILSNASTIIEEYIFLDMFNFLEHGFYTLAGLLFFVGAIRMKAY